jgi:hypothetical protein
LLSFKLVIAELSKAGKWRVTPAESWSAAYHRRSDNMTKQLLQIQDSTLVRYGLLIRENFGFAWSNKPVDLL